MRPNPKFSPGDVVQRANQPEALGVVRDARWDPQAEGWNYSVQLGGQLRVMPEESIESLRAVVSPWDSLLHGSVSGARHFAFVMTYHRLRRPPTRIAYSFSTSRTEFYPHQFSPLLKFLDHPSRRLLIADDVGLGKTIEAGYILRELRARQAVERVLVVVPARLGPKWKREFQTRFDESFEVVRRAELLDLIQRVRQGREIEPFRWIVSYEQVRAEEVQGGFRETNPPIDVLIMDEAHRLRNPETLQHRAGVTLCQVSDVVLLLSATPVQNRLEDLWNLLRLLAPEEFGNWELFRSQIEANRPLLLVQKALAKRPARLEEAVGRMQEFLANPAGAQLVRTEIVQSIARRLASSKIEGRDLVELRADISRLSPTGHIITRTRKAEALPHRPKREAGWVRVELTAAERSVYDSVAELCRLAYGLDHESWGARMALLQAYRMTASSIPAAVRYFAERIGGGVGGAPAESQPPESDGGEDVEETETGIGSAAARAKMTRAIAQYERVAEADSKLTCLVDAVTKVWRDDDQARRTRRKIVVFSAFTRTLEYLRQALATRKIVSRMIHGGVPVEEREVVIDEFLERGDVLVLLTSEVGGEGIDLQRACVVVNYDLPWNPMVVEQRIGRVDRIGQESARIVVINLVVADSVEEVVLRRLLEKIGIFEESIGELDPIIGDEIQRLTELALRGELADDELTRAVEETGEALHRRILAAHEMLGRLDGLLAADEAIVDEIQAVTDERQLPTGAETRLFVNEFLGERFPGCQIPEEAVRRVVSLNFEDGLPAAIEQAGGAGLDPQAMNRFSRRISSGPVSVTLSRDAAYRYPRADLLHLRHPLVRFVVSEIESGRGRIHKAFSLVLAESDVLAPGLYAFAISLVEIRGYRASIKLCAAFVDVKSSREWASAESTAKVLLELLDHAEDGEVPGLTEDDLDSAKRRATGALNRMVSEWSAREQALDYARREQQHTAMRATGDIRLRRARERLLAVKRGSAAEFAMRMAQAQVDKAEQLLEGVSKQAPVRSWAGAEQEEVAVGFLRVGRL